MIEKKAATSDAISDKANRRDKKKTTMAKREDKTGGMKIATKARELPVIELIATASIERSGGIDGRSIPLGTRLFSSISS